jgi:prepilin-type N-terminal cleavage/methylation domain-containing protein
MKKTINGFTIVELLIVIVVIGILAAITLVAYNGVQARAYDTAVQNDLAGIKKKIELAKVDNNSQYPYGAGASNLLPLGIKISQKAYATSPQTNYNVWYCHNATQQMFTVIALAKTGKIFYVTEQVGPTHYTGPQAWDPNSWNCNTMVNTNQGWQYAGYASDGSGGGPWRPWTGAN